MKDKLSARQARMQAANALICVIASFGHRFFADTGAGHTAYFMAKNGRPWFVDGCTGKAIYTQYQGRWRGFTGGGTLRELVDWLRAFIMHGVRLRPRMFGPWPDYVCNGDLWGYGQDMQRVRDAAAALGITEAEPAKEPEETYDCSGTWDHNGPLDLANPTAATIDEVVEALNKQYTDRHFYLDQREGEPPLICSKLRLSGKSTLEFVPAKEAK